MTGQALAEIFPLSADATHYRQLSSDHVGTESFRGQDVLVVEKEALRLLSEAAFTDINHLLRPGHLRQLASILQDPEATDNDRFVAYDLLKNANIAAGGILPMCQDTGTAIIMGKKGGNVWTGGGDEAALFAGDLARMYQRYAEAKGWRWEVIEEQLSELGGVRELVVRIAGEGVFARLKYESGVHRVQRVPETESGGRIHTSAATVAVLPEAEEVDIRIDPNDLRIDTMRSSGAGGQHVNTTDSAVRITHIPTGIVVTSSEKSQHRNREIAMQVLRARLFDQQRQQADAERSADRKAQVGSGDRSERIRTYNFPQGRLTDHRIGLTLYRLEQVMAGDLDEIVDALTSHAQAAQLAEMEG